ncbi:MAG: DUF1583 domain-containing protein, partial [Planctomycetota bacterium]
IYDQIVSAADETSGRLRVVRRGGQIHCLFAPAGDERFQLLASHAVGTTPVSHVTFSGQCSDSVGKAELKLKQLQIRESNAGVGQVRPNGLSRVSR